jgi:hypothetical protein
VIAAIRTDMVPLRADGDQTVNFAEVDVPLGLLRGRWRLHASRDGEEWVRSINPLGREVVEPTYYRPRFAAAKKPAVAERSESAGWPAERTGTVGRPTSWHMVEAELRRRYSEGERHPGKVGQSPAAWASVLIAWLRENIPTAPPLGEKAARNNLSRLLRELEKESLK